VSGVWPWLSSSESPAVLVNSDREMSTARGALQAVQQFVPSELNSDFWVVQKPARCRPAWVFDILQLELADRLNRQGVFTAITTRGLKTLIT